MSDPTPQLHVKRMMQLDAYFRRMGMAPRYDLMPLRCTCCFDAVVGNWTEDAEQYLCPRCGQDLLQPALWKPITAADHQTATQLSSQDGEPFDVDRAFAEFIIARARADEALKAQDEIRARIVKAFHDGRKTAP